VEGRIFVCSWKKDGDRYRVWVKNRPKLSAEGDTFQAADEELWSVILRATGDGENTREYDPPQPVAGDGRAEFLAYEIVVVQGNSSVYLTDAALFDGARCARCGNPSGTRTAKPLFLEDIESGMDGGYAIIREGRYARIWRPFFSETFVDMLAPSEKAQFQWRRIERPPRGKKVFYELLSSTVDFPLVGVRGLAVKNPGWTCRDCGRRVLPRYVDWDWPPYYLCTSDLPSSLPSCFTVSDSGDRHLCFHQTRWSELLRKAKPKLLSNDVGVVPADRCDRKPALKKV
jgi:hypothetical protein